VRDAVRSGAHALHRHQAAMLDWRPVMRALRRPTFTTIVAFIGISVAVSLSAQAAARAGNQGPPPPDEVIAIEDFLHRVDTYVMVHRVAEGQLPMLHPTWDMREIRQQRLALAARIRATRPNAKQGDIITPEAARLFQRRIAACLSLEAWVAVLAERDEEQEGVPIRNATVRVNMPWPENAPFGFVPPQLIAALPPLPGELRYGIIGRSLVLWDYHADVIVDVLPEAFPCR
jgi:hypothetical protein